MKNIRLVPDAADGHDIECKIDGFGAMKLKSSVVKKEYDNAWIQIKSSN